MKFLSFLLILFFIGCSFKPEVVVDNTKTYVLKDNNDQIYISSKTNPKILKIISPSLPMYLNNQNITYFEKLNSKDYVLNFLEDTPSNFYVFMLLSKFEKSNIFKAYVDENSNVLADYALESRIDAFEQVVDKNENFVLIKISVNIIDLNTNNLIAHKYFTIKQDIQIQKIDEVIYAFNKALNSISNEVVFWVGEISNKE